MRLKDGEIYIYHKDGGFEPYDVTEYNYKGYTLDKLYQLNLDRKKIVSKLKNYRDKLLKYSPHLSGDTLYDVIDMLIDNEKLKIVNLNDRYYVFDIKDGYIEKVAYGSNLGKYTLPDDVENGLYYFDDKNNIVRDEYKEEEEWISAAF